MAKSRRKACSPCVKAKRHCDLRIPQCRRCSVRGFECLYGAGAVPQDQSGPDYPFTNDELLFNFSSLDGPILPDPGALNRSDQLLIALGPVHPNSGGLTQGGHLATPSTLDYDSYTEIPLLSTSESNRQPDVAPSGATFDAAVLQLYVSEVKKWLQQWVTKGSNPFIHPQLYYENFPSEIQDAYSCCSIYSTKNSKNQRTVLRIIEQKVAILMGIHHQQPPPPQPQRQEQQQQQQQFPPTLSLSQHLTRVQCLLIYQIIRLFDSDIRQQSLAEQDAPILNAWILEMWDSLMKSGLDVYHSDSSNPSSSSSTSGQTQKKQRDPHSQASPATNWKEWVLVESVRRTLITAHGITGVYDTMKLGITVCPGGESFIASAAVWDAPSAYRWEKVWQERERRYLISKDSLPLLVCQARASDVDEFGKVLLMLLHSGETVEKWIAETGNGRGWNGLMLGV
ncbi:hypothetical protein AJ78_03559 [Emergomyces pasteurianus Ep9510]|uniref:Zn(2)-C6 fungal-type domain-containing protein n=1 Tax=Emergomyces pasteurianus Ep9510 TaxID=1447872 RepID=A0A1J9QK47_9EURO|nr:hypothetical protein AJ78_03559 [Emergomyces pasteurianus Ep9510]